MEKEREKENAQEIKKQSFIESFFIFFLHLIQLALDYHRPQYYFLYACESQMLYD